MYFNNNLCNAIAFDSFYICKIKFKAMNCNSEHKDCCCATHNHSAGHEHNHSHGGGEKGLFKMFLPAIVCAVLLLSGVLLDYFNFSLFSYEWIKFSWFALSYLPVGLPVFKEMFEGFRDYDFFNEFSLMSLASLGAFYLREYPEAVSVMLFYSIGENFQDLAVQKAKKNINELLDQRPDEAVIFQNGEYLTIKAEEISVGSVVHLKPGEKLALDGELKSEYASFNTAALTGESVPSDKKKGDTVLAGMINLGKTAEYITTNLYSDSKLSKILQLVQDSNKQKAKTELFIKKFSKIYTPAVFFLAVMVCLFPYFIVDNYNFHEWFYRSLIFLVISCPCALVISIPLGYFGGIGRASYSGILVKGGNFLDALANIKNVVFDKTGTLTKGIFAVQEVHINQEFEKSEVLNYINDIESTTTHPIATAIKNYVGKEGNRAKLQAVEDIPGKGLKAEIQGKTILVGNFKLMEKFNIAHNVEYSHIYNTIIAVAIDNVFAGYLTISDEIKEDAAQTIYELKELGVNSIMLSGDKSTVVKSVAEKIGMTTFYGDLLPEDKVEKLKEIKASGEKTAFAGDGMNDAPVIALSDVGIAMGGLGSDASIETADVIIQDDQPSRIPLAIKIGKATKRIVWQNIIFAFGVKIIVMILGAGGLANMWEAVFADVGVAMLAILNAVRLQKMKF